MDPTAEVSHNQRLPDRHHRGGRQRDVWINAKVCGHFPVSVLVSCKRLKRRLHSGDVDAFHGELLSSSARLGVLYSYSGFAKPAIEKGRALGIPCCRLYVDQPPELPEVLWFTSYCCASKVRVQLAGWPTRGWHLETWDEVFQLSLEGPSGKRSLLSELVSRFHAAEAEAVQAVRGEGPQPFSAEVIIPPPGPDGDPLQVRILGEWKYYRGRLEAHRVRGSYEFTQGSFTGEVATPSIDRLSADPGPGWERIERLPSTLQNAALVILYKGNAEEVLMKEVGPKALR